MKKRIMHCIAVIPVLAIVLLILWPLGLMVSFSTWRSEDIVLLYQQSAPVLTLIPPVASLEQFVRIVFEQSSYLTMFVNSLLLSVGISLGAIVIDFFAGYVLAKVPFRGQKLIYGSFVFMMLLPSQVTLLPIYIASRALHLINSWWSLILPGIFTPLGVFFMQQFFLTVPDEMYACMRLETKSTLRMLLQGILPCVKPGLIALFVVLFAENWSMVEQPLLLLSDPATFPLSLALCSKTTVPAEVVFAAAVIFALPAFVLYALCQDQIQDGLGGIQPK